MVGAAGEEPPPAVTPFRSAVQAATRSSIVWNGEPTGTTMAPDSSTSFAIAVVPVSFASEFWV
nr:hypothetical protein GCM10025732_08510 [Glycomyces mayteni]